MILFNILITDDGSTRGVLPEKVQENLDSFKRAHPALPHRLFRGEEVRHFLAEHFGRDVVQAYDALKPYAYQADIARYCILYQLGGVYADLSYFFFRSWPPQAPRLAVFRDFLSATPWDTSNGVIAAPPGHKALAKAIELVCANVARRYYGPTTLCPTGPTLFGKSIALTCEPEDIIVGEARWFTPPPLRVQVPCAPSHCLFASDRLIAIKRKKGGGPITELGLTAGNEYSKLWAKKDIYR